MRKLLLIALLAACGTVQAQKIKTQDIQSFLEKANTVAKSDLFQDIIKGDKKNAIANTASDSPAPSGFVNWTQQYVEEYGVAPIDKERVKAVGYKLAEEEAYEMAQWNAFPNLVRRLGAVHVTYDYTLENYISSKKLNIHLEDWVRKAEIVSQETIDGEFVRVTMRCPLINSLGPLAATSNNPPIDDLADIEVLDQLIENGQLAEGTTEFPPVVIDIPEEQLEGYDPALYTTVVLRDSEGNETEIVLDESIGINRQTSEIICTSAELLQQTGVLENVIHLKGEVKNGRIEIQLPEQNEKDTKKARNREKWNKAFEKALKIAPLLLMFL